MENSIDKNIEPVDCDKVYKFEIELSEERVYLKDKFWGVVEFSTLSDSLPFTREARMTEAFIGTLLGKMHQLDYGLKYDVTAKLEPNKKYDTYGGSKYQYQVIEIKSKKPTTQEEQSMFLRVVLTPKQAESLLSVYPEIVEMIIQGKDKEVDLDLVKGIGEASFEKIKEKVLKNYVIQDILVMLKPLGVTYNAILKMLDFEDNPLILKKKIKENPYILTKIRGFGFSKVDAIALKLNPDLDESMFRLKAFLEYQLKYIGNSEGHTCIPKKRLKKEIRQNIYACEDLYDKFIIDEQENPTILKFHGEYVGLKRFFENARYFVKRLEYLDKQEPMFEPFSDKEIEDSIKITERELGFSFTEDQKGSIRCAGKKNVVIISGSSGSGKSSVLKGITDLLKRGRLKRDILMSGISSLDKGDELYYSRIYGDDWKEELIKQHSSKINIAQCALSAKAARRIHETTQLPSGTMHSLLEFGDSGFAKGESDPINANVCNLDEMSMINTGLLRSYVSALPIGGKAIFVFDFAQLPPIGEGDASRDILLSKTLSIFVYDKVHRQGLKSGILVDANMIRVGKNPIDKLDRTIIHGEEKDMFYKFSNDTEELIEIAIKMYIKSVNDYGLEDVMFMTPKKSSGDMCSMRISKTIQDILIPKDVPFVLQNKDGIKTRFKLGAKVINKDNNKELGIINGDEGYITKIHEGGNYFDVEFLQYIGNDIIRKNVTFKISQIYQLILGYCQSAHSTQGSEASVAIFAMDSSSMMMHNRRILYTAMTRAKKKSAVVSTPKAFKNCVSDYYNKPRKTWMNLHFTDDLEFEDYDFKDVNVKQNQTKPNNAYKDTRALPAFIKMEKDDDLPF